MKLLNKVGIGIAALLVAMLASFVVYEMRFESMANGFFDAIKQKNVELTRSYLPNNGDGQEYAALFNELVPQGAALNFKADNLFSQKDLLFTKDKSLSGTIHPEGIQKPVPVTVLFVSENNVWKVKEVKENVEKGQPTTAENQEKAKILGLARQSMADFILSKKAKSMEHFFGTISDTWKKETSIDKLNKSFEPILNENPPIDWSFLNPVEPAITKYAVNKDGVLTIIGVYPSKPKRLIFEQNFVNENNTWKLAGFKLFTADAEDNQPADAKSAPEEKKAVESKKSTKAMDAETKK